MSGIRVALRRARERRFGLRRVVSRGVMLSIGAVSIYLAAPAVLEVFSAWSALRDLKPGWFALVAVGQLLTLGSLWAVQRLVLRTTRWRAVITSQLAGNAASRLIPGGAAAGTAVQFRLLRSAGISTETAATGRAVSGLLQVAMTLLLPIVALPGVVLGAPVPDGLLRVAWAGVGLFVVLVGLAAALLADVATTVAGGALGGVITAFDDGVDNAMMRKLGSTLDMHESVLLALGEKSEIAKLEDGFAPYAAELDYEVVPEATQDLIKELSKLSAEDVAA